MLEQQGNALYFEVFYTESKVGKTGLTVTCYVYEATTKIVTAGACVEVGDGWYYYLLTSGNVDANASYRAIFKTGTTSVDQQWIPSLWVVGRTWVNRIDAALSTIAAGVQAVIGTYATGPDITRRRGDSWSIAITGLGALTGYTSLWFTVKRGADNVDSASIVQIKKNASGTGDGLLYLNGAAGTAGQGSITIDDAAAGNITIALDEAASTILSPARELHYDIQVLIGGTVTTLTEALFHVTGDYTRAVA